MKVTLSSVVREKGDLFQIAFIFESLEELERLKQWLAKRNMNLVLLMDYFLGKESVEERESELGCIFTIGR